MECPNQHGRMELKSMAKELSFRGKRIKFRAQHFVCAKCGIEADDLDLATANQKALSDAYRSAVKLLTGEQIVEGAEETGLDPGGPCEERPMWGSRASRDGRQGKFRPRPWMMSCDGRFRVKRRVRTLTQGIDPCHCLGSSSCSSGSVHC